MFNIFKGVIGIRHATGSITNTQGRDITHLVVLIKIIEMLIYNNIRPIFVFDSARPECKATTIKARRNKLHNRLVKCGADTTSTRIMSSEFKLDCYELLEAFGIPYVISPEEAEAQCAALSHYYPQIGGNNIIKDIASRNHRDSHMFQLNICCNMLRQRANVILAELGHPLYDTFTHDQFIKYNIMKGCDYFPGIGVHGNILFRDLILCDFDIMRLLQIHDKTHMYESYNIAYEYYTSAPVIDPAMINININPPNYDNMRHILGYVLDYTPSKIRKLYDDMTSFYRITRIIDDSGTKSPTHASSMSYRVKYAERMQQRNKQNCAIRQCC
jgi:5'-3' exonuclease